MAKAKSSDESRSIKLRVCMAGSGFVWDKGDVVSVPSDEAERIVKAGFASWADDVAPQS
jgi:hypothetical protein